MRVLFVTSEAYPLVKTGGLADVSASLPRALQSLGHQVTLLMPAYREALAAAGPLGVKLAATRDVGGQHVRLLQTRLPGSRNKVWLLDCPALFDRPGNPYHDADGHAWADNAERFMLLCRVGALLAEDAFDLGWRPEVVHCNDWQSALVPLLLHARRPRPALVFTIHNLAYQGLFSREDFERLGIAPHYWHPDALEFHGSFSFIKGGIVFADRVTTVSPSYAREIQTEEFGHGLDGLLRHRAPVLSGILNGIDTTAWNPSRDPALALNYGTATLARKRQNKIALQAEMGLDTDPSVPLCAFIGRLAQQKGIDLLLGALPELLAYPAQAVMLGSGDAAYETALAALADAHPGRIALRIGYDEALAHRIEAGADIFLMPSRFEPCGLNQMYSLRYGTVPVVHHVGGLADTVVDATPEALADASANGFSFRGADAGALVAAARRALASRADTMLWTRLQLTGMRRDFSWRHSARAYEQLYRDALADAAGENPVVIPAVEN
ncbi:MAG: glycogen synthase GlgA [Pseudomonadales bacterium]|nr:glycogen synthase GlgA [Pseudomonadales bacterium]